MRRKATKYVYEIQEEIGWRKCRYEVEAESEEEALELAKSGQAIVDAIDYGNIGSPELGDTVGWSVGDGTDDENCFWRASGFGLVKKARSVYACLRDGPDGERDLEATERERLINALEPFYSIEV